MYLRKCLIMLTITLLILPVAVQAAETEKKITPESLPGVKVVDAATVKKWLDEGDDLFILDARKAPDYDAGHLPGAEIATVPSDLNVSDEAVAKSVTALEKVDALQDVEKDTKIVTYCNNYT